MAGPISYYKAFDRRALRGNYACDGKLRGVDQQFHIRGLQMARILPESEMSEHSSHRSGRYARDRNKQLSELLNIEIPESPAWADHPFPQMLEETDERIVFLLERLELRHVSDDDSHEEVRICYLFSHVVNGSKEGSLC